MDGRHNIVPVDSKWTKLTMPVSFEVLQKEPIKSFDVPPNKT